MKVFMSFCLFSALFISCGGEAKCGGNFPHEHEGLCWSEKSPKYLNWEDANKFCTEKGGRLPTISELRTLVQNCPATETGGACGVTDACTAQSCRNEACDGCPKDTTGKYSALGDSVEVGFHSSSIFSNDNNYSWIMAFQKANMVDHSHNEGALARVRCVEKE